MKSLILLVLVITLLGVQVGYGQSEQGTHIILTTDIDSLTLYVPPGQDANLTGLAFASSLTNQPIPLAIYQGFQSLPFDNLPVPFCFQLIRPKVEPVIPLVCQDSSLIQQFVAINDIFWYSEGTGTSGLVVTIQGGEEDLLCVPSQRGCELVFTANAELASSSVPMDPIAPPLTAPDIICNIDNAHLTIILTASCSNVNPGDPPEIVAEKLLHQRRRISAEIFFQLQAVDIRLSFTLVVLDPDDFSSEMGNVRATVVPAANQIFENGYDRLILEHQIAELREIFDANQLMLEPTSILIEYIEQSGLKTDDIEFFYDQLTEVQGASENIVAQLDMLTAAIEDGVRQEWLDYYQDSLQNEIDTLVNHSRLAYLYSQVIFANIVDLETDIESEIPFGRLQLLNPTDLMSSSELVSALAIVTNESEVLSEQREALKERAQGLLEEDQQIFEDIDLTIYPDDTWDVVVAKAISLRQLGRTNEAIEAFAQYGVMFSADPTAEQYAETAHWFTLQAEVLGVIWHGVYIYGIEPGSPADEAGLLVGDILVEYDGQELTGVIPVEGTDGISGIQYMQQVLEGDLSGEVNVTYLRLQPDKTFVRQTATLTLNGRVGVGLMPI